MDNPIKKEILVCDDAEGVQAAIKLILEREFNITLANNEIQLFKLLRNNKDFDLIFLDFDLGGSNGIDALIKIKAEFPNIKVILITGHEDVNIEAEAFRYGACGFILKPFKSRDILDSVYKNISK